MILVTGFGPYKEAMNASGALVQSLRDDPPELLSSLADRLVFDVISCDETSRETEHESLERRLFALLEHHMPELCIFTGQAAPYNRITIERIATNSFMREIIDPARPVAYWSDLPGSDDLRTLLEDEGIPAGYSFYSGQHLCNHILYSSRYFAENNNLAHRSGFIHVPVLPEQVIREHRESPGMPLEMTRRALALIIRHVVDAYPGEVRAYGKSRKL